MLEEIREIERAIVEGDRHALAVRGDVRANLKRLTKLKELARRAQCQQPSIDAFETWRSTRLRGGWS